MPASSPNPRIPNADALQTFKPRFAGLVAVCGDCQKRSSGPSKLKARDVQKELKRGLVRAPIRVRTVRCGCLGLCPKKAIAVGISAAGQPMLCAEVHNADEAAALPATVVAAWQP
ncbi:MAG: hypothetical protein EOP81_19275 [Variovorax sp.]|nr:MAG: hypothetical protein EOP81_19275 [Variovorax sp.]